MRFMMIVKASKESEAGVMQSEKALGTMAKYNEELAKAGIMLDGTGLQPSSKGARVKFQSGKRTVIDGPFAEAKELIAGYWLIQAKSLADAIEWAKRAPMDVDGQDAEIEIRQLFELEDFEQGEAIEHHRRIQEELARKK
jgi:hypothetical protein